MRRLPAWIESDTISNATRAIVEIIAVCLFAIVLVEQALNVFLRYTQIGAPIMWVEDFTKYALIWMFFLLWHVCDRERTHFVVDFLVEKVAPNSRRALEVVSHAIAIVFCLIVVISAFPFIADTMGYRTQSFSWLPMGVVYVIIPVGLLIVVFERVRLLAKRLFKSDEESKFTWKSAFAFLPIVAIVGFAIAQHQMGGFSHGLTIAFLFAIMLVLIVLGVPLVYSIGAAATVMVLTQPGMNTTLLPSRMFKGVESFVLASIPFFLLAAEILTSGGLIQRMITFARLLIGHIRGGLAQVNILVSMIFAGIQASCTADSAAIGGVLIPAMVKEKYDKDLSVIVTATSSCCGPIIPPSILMILYAFLTETSVGKLFLGGAIPGVILGIALMGITHYWVIKRGYEKSRESIAPVGEIAKAGAATSPAFIVPLIIVVGLVGGLVTPTEAGVLACVAALIVAGFIYRELSFGKLTSCFKRAAYTTAVIWAVIAASSVFSEILVRNLFARRILEAISWITTDPTGVLLTMTLIVFLLGMAIDTTPLLIMLAAPLYKAGTQVGIDPVHLGVILVMTALIGTVSPPVAILLCLNCGIAKIPLSATFRMIWSYLIVMLGVVVLCIIFPGLVTWLPSLFSD